MSAESNRFIAAWQSHKTQRNVATAAAIAVTLALYAALGTIWHLVHRRDVIRIGDDGIPVPITLPPNYEEPQYPEVRAFVTQIAVPLARFDSYSALNDLLFCAQHMEPRFRKRFMQEAQAAVAAVEPLQQRTYVDPNTLKIEIHKARDSWLAKVSGTRQVIGQEQEEPFSLEIDIAKTSRSQIVWGMLVSRIRSRGGPVGTYLPATRG